MTLAIILLGGLGLSLICWVIGNITNGGSSSCIDYDSEDDDTITEQSLLNTIFENTQHK